MAEDQEDRVRVSYGAAKYERLAQIKAAYDPDNVFNRNMNIKPALPPVYTNAKVKPAWSGARPTAIPPWLWFRR